MTLSLIVGPPNSGRTGRVLAGFRAALERDPVLVVPTLDDAERFERELTENGGAVLGATVCTFERLFGLVAAATEAEVLPALSGVQGRRVAREAVARAGGLELLAASARRTGFASALAELIDELQAARVDPVTLSARAAEAGPYEAEVARLYAGYCAVRDELGRGDSHTRATAAIAALRAQPDAWGARPLFLYGFDDLTVEQLELVRVLLDACEVTIALPWEDRAVLADARGALFAELREVPGATVEHLDPNPAYTESATLRELERRFGEPPSPGASLIGQDGGIALLASAGERAEAEAVGAEVARLLDAGTPADEIAIVLRSPEALGPLYRRVFDAFAIPLAVQAELPIARTLTGAGMLALLEAALGRGRAADLLAYLRTPGIDSPERVDWFERRLLRGRLSGAEEAAADWASSDSRRELVELERLRGAEGPGLAREAARQARWLAEGALRGKGATAGGDRTLELRAGAEIAGGLEELAELGLPLDGRGLIEAVGELTVPLWRGPTEGRVRVLSPYRARARRVEHLFVCSLQDGDFPRRDSGGPLLSDDARAALALRPRVTAEAEDRYLFASALSRPSRRLWLSWRAADDEGGATARSPFVDEVRELLHPPVPAELAARDEALAAEAAGRGLAEPVFAPGSAPSADELARALAGTAEAGSVALAPDGVPDEVAGQILARIEAARESVAPGRRRPGPLSLPAVTGQLAAQRLFGPRTLEEYETCSYRWFVDHELKPRRIEPDPEAMTAGSVAHRVLELLYREQPGGEPRPTPATLERWRERAEELIAEAGAERLPSERADTAATLHRTRGLVLAFLADEAATPLAFQPDPELAEAAFGTEDADKPAFPVSEEAMIHGVIDRIDLGPAGEALVQDYKTGTKVEGGAKMLERGKLQLQLYLLAVRELWGLELAGGLYRPLGGTSDRRPKGLLRKQLAEELSPLAPRPGDHLTDEAFERALAAARERAAEVAARIRAGEIKRDPRGGKCPDYCGFQPICRRERGLPEDDGPDEEAE